MDDFLRLTSYVCAINIGYLQKLSAQPGAVVVSFTLPVAAITHKSGFSRTFWDRHVERSASAFDARSRNIYVFLSLRTRPRATSPFVFAQCSLTY